MRILITGGAGFIGSHLANQLVQRGHFIRVIDDLSSGDPARLVAGINFNRGDVRDIPKLWSLLQGVELVYHLAARVSVPASILYPREYNDVNVGGTVALLEACRDVGIKRVVLASSATVYGEQAIQPVSESVEPRPTAPYAVSKLAAEQYLFTIGKLSGFETVALRIFNAYGPGQLVPPVHPPVVPQFVQQVIGKGSVIVNGPGIQTRDFVYIDDVVDALINAGITSNGNGNATANSLDRQVINIGSGVECSINQLVTEIAAIIGTKPNILHNDEDSGGVTRLVADLTKAKQLLKFTPRTNLKKGLTLLLDQDPFFRRFARQIKELTNKVSH